MKKKFLILFLCMAVLFGVFSILSFAAEQASTNSAMKSGIERGDIVWYAGVSEPIAWWVIDPEKSNTDDENGLFLLSKDTSKLVETTYSTELTRLKPYYEQVYDAFFSDYYRTAVMAVSKVDESSTLYGDPYNDPYEGKLDNDTVFSLSLPEVMNLTDEERSFASRWWIRSLCLMYYNSMFSQMRDNSFLFNFTDKSGVNYIGNTNDSASSIFHIRPAVNIDRTKLADFDEKLLLLPAGEFSEAANTLVSLGTAKEWKLTQKNSDVTITHVTSVVGEYNGQYTLTIDTNLPDVGDNDCISLVIKKSDGSFSHYGRYPMTSATRTIELDLPYEYEENDAVYVFYEDYRGTMAGSAGELVKVCLEHRFECQALDEITHRFTCLKCGYTEDAAHILEKTDKDAAQHMLYCYDCGYRGYEDHTLKPVEADDENHILECVGCGRRETEEHAYTVTIGDTQTFFDCAVCGKRAPFSAIENDFDETVAVLRDEYQKGSAKIYEGKGKYSGSTESGIFSDDTLVYVVSDGVVQLTFNTDKPVKATGFKIVTVEDSSLVPQKINLYGRINSLVDYQLIGTAILRPLLPTLSEGDSYAGKTYSFLFANPAQAAYSDYMLEMYKDYSDHVGGTADPMQFRYFGLLSEKNVDFTYRLDGAVVQGDALNAVYPGESLTFTALSKTGHPKKENIAVFVDGTKLDYASWSYSEETGEFILLGENISNEHTYSLEIVCADKALNVEHILTGLTLTQGDAVAEFGKDYTCEFADSFGQTIFVPTSLESGDIKVYCGDVDITAQCDGSSLGTNGKLTVPGQYVLGDLKIVAGERNSAQTENSVIKIERAGKRTHWYEDTADAVKDAALGGELTVTLLKDVTIPFLQPGFVIENGRAIFDLNGYTMEAGRYITAIDARNNADVVIRNGAIVPYDDATAACRVSDGATLSLQNVSVYREISGDFYGCIEVSDGNLLVHNDVEKEIYAIIVWDGANVKIQNGLIDNLNLYTDDGCKIYGGRVFKAGRYEGSLLNNIPLKYAELLGEGCEFYNIWSQEDFDAGEPTGFSVRCSHVNIDETLGECKGCGHRFLFTTVNGENVKYYDEIYDVIAYANENANTTIKLLDDVTPENQALGSGLKFTGNHNTTFDLNGKSFETTISAISILDGTLTVTGNGIMNTNMVTAWTGDSYSLLIIENGTFYGASGNLLLKGGTFENIYSQKPLSMLAEGKAFRNKDGLFVSPMQRMTDVTVTDIPFVVTKQPEGGLISDNSDVTISVEAVVRPEYKDFITYAWYERTAEYDNDKNSWKYTDTLLNGETTPQLQLPEDLPVGTQKSYVCMVSCLGYEVYTENATFTFGTKAPLLEWDSENLIITVNGYGVDYVLQVETYIGEQRLQIATKTIYGRYGEFKDGNLIDINTDGADNLKISLWDAEQKTQVVEPIVMFPEVVYVEVSNGIYMAASNKIDCVCVLASYEEGRLVDTVFLNLDKSNDYYAYIEYNADPSKELKAFVFKDLQSLKPLRFTADLG